MPLNNSAILQKLSPQVERYEEEHIKVKVESVMQPGFLVAAAAAAAAYRDAGFCTPGCHGCTGEVVPSNLLPSLLTVVISAASVPSSAVQDVRLARRKDFFVCSFGVGVCACDRLNKSSKKVFSEAFYCKRQSQCAPPPNPPNPRKKNNLFSSQAHTPESSSISGNPSF